MRNAEPSSNIRNIYDEVRKLRYKRLPNISNAEINTSKLSQNDIYVIHTAKKQAIRGVVISSLAFLLPILLASLAVFTEFSSEDMMAIKIVLILSSLAIIFISIKLIKNASVIFKFSHISRKEPVLPILKLLQSRIQAEAMKDEFISGYSSAAIGMFILSIVLIPLAILIIVVRTSLSVKAEKWVEKFNATRIRIEKLAKINPEELREASYRS